VWTAPAPRSSARPDDRLEIANHQQAYTAVDYRTIILLFGMMIVVANLRVSGFFTLVSAWVVEHAHRPVVLLAAIVLGRASSPRFS
jgi:Na+/H+ antiporter NhaD/arsenite permease-like protein